MGTKFTEVYNCFLSKITDDMYLELTPKDTVEDLQNLLINSIPYFEFPRVVISDYEIKTELVLNEEVQEDDFIIGYVWNEIGEDEFPDDLNSQYVVVEHSSFANDLTKEEINILALIMLEHWVQRQVTSIENTRMKYSGTDFKMTSQANHLSKLLALLKEVQRQSLHMQRLYKRRKVDAEDGSIKSNWSVLRFGKYHK